MANDREDQGGPEGGTSMDRAVGRKERRRLRARGRGGREIWFGLGTFGLIGWSVAIPVLLLTALGVWLDREFPSRISWTLTLLLVGFVVGCLNAWYWLGGERREIERESVGNENEERKSSADERKST